VLVTDVVLYRVTADPVLIARVETAKGWAFVAFATALLYVVTLRSTGRLASAHSALSAIIDSIADGLLLLGPDRAIVRANPAAARMLNSSGLVGMGAEEFARRFRVSRPSGSLVRPDQFISQRVFDEGKSLNYKAVLHPPGASEIVISATAAPVGHDADGGVESVVSIMHDITASEHLERLRDQFLAAAAHTLKTPVAVIKVNAHALSLNDASVVEQASAAIERQCQRIDRLVQNLLVLARVRTDSLQLHTEELELAPLVECVTRDMDRASPSCHVRSVIEASPRVYADQERLSLALSNLIDEAIRSAPCTSTVTVTLRQRDGNALIGVSCRANEGPVREASAVVSSEYDESGIERLVAESVVEAHAGSLRGERAGKQAGSWISLACTARDDVPR